MKNLGLIVVVLVALAGAAWFNYQRNAPLDKDLEFRPYSGLSDGDLASLIDAYELDVVTKTQGLGDGPDHSGISRSAPSDFGGKLQAFERFQAENARWKAGHRAAVEGKVVIDRLLKERAIRDAGLDQEWRRILRRVATP